MKAHGREVGDAWELGLDEDPGPPISLREVTLFCSSDQLRVLSKFLIYAADLIDRHGDDFGHEHLQDWWPDWQDGFVDLIVAREETQSVRSAR